MMEELLQKYNLKYEDLNAAEIDTLNTWLSSVQQTELSIAKLREYLARIRDSVEMELIDEPEFIYIFIFKVPNRKQILLKARLKNYLLLEAFISTPERAKAMLEQAIAGLKAR